MYHFKFERKVLPDERFKRVWGVRTINHITRPLISQIWPFLTLFTRLFPSFQGNYQKYGHLSKNPRGR